MMIKLKSILFILFAFYALDGFSQSDLRPNPYINGLVIFKNGDSINGFVKLNTSAFDIRFKDSLKQKKRKKIKFKEVEKIIAYSDSKYPREFYYKKTDQSNFFHFVELIHRDTINVYITTSDRLGLFYSDSEVDRRSGREIMNDTHNELYLNIFPIEKNLSFFNQYSPFINNFNLHREIQRIDYFLHKKNQEELVLIGTKGNFLYKNFKKTATKYFEDCPILIEKIQSRELKLKHLPDIIEYYKQQCK